jgi:hypothetical protein
VRTLQVTIGLALFLLVVVNYQPFRGITRGRAAEQALAGAPAPLGALPAVPPNQAMYVVGTLGAASDVRRERPVETAPAWSLVFPRVQHWLAPGTRLRDASGEAALEGRQIELAGAATDYPYGAVVAAYGAPQAAAVEVWALGPDRAALAQLAAGQTALLHWPWLLIGLVLAATGYGLALGGTYALGRAIGRPRLARPRLAGIALALYLMVGFGLLGSAWAMLWPMVAGALLTAAVALALARRQDRHPPAAAR